LMSAYPEKDSNGTTKAIFGCIVSVLVYALSVALQSS
jgi:hypothetical protein